MLLDRKTRIITATIVTAYTIANSVKMSAEWVDTEREKVTPFTNLVTAVIGSNTLVSAPADSVAREVQELTIFNGDSVTHDVIVGFFENAVLFTVKYAVALPTNKTLYYNRLTGWVIV